MDASIVDSEGKRSSTFPSELRAARERMESGEWFDAADPALDLARSYTRTRLIRFNTDATLTPDERSAILRDLLAHLGDHSDLMPGLQMDYGFNVSIGDRCFFNFNTVFLDGAPITFGDDVWVGPNCTFATPNHPLVAAERAMRVHEDGSTHCYERNASITIGGGVWIASGVTVNSGVTIGEGSVIGAGSVVTRDIPAGVLAMGIPCKPIRAITQEDSVENLLASL